MMSYEKECHTKLKCICNKLHNKFEFKFVKETFATNLNLNLKSYLYRPISKNPIAVSSSQSNSFLILNMPFSNRFFKLALILKAV
jgi:hypothetical protein